MRGFLHYYYKDVYAIRPVRRELNYTVVCLGCGFDSPASGDAVDRFLTDLEHVLTKSLTDSLNRCPSGLLRVDINPRYDIRATSCGEPSGKR